jgi:hypothetical protein
MDATAERERVHRSEAGSQDMGNYYFLSPILSRFNHSIKD